MQNAALVSFVGRDVGDTNGGGWGFPSPYDELWDITTGTTTSGSRRDLGDGCDFGMRS